ncbi:MULTISPECIES: sensor histidine kinase [Paenibacillus]|nr:MULTISPECIES: ATP-binding protein [Paenibacillus]KAF6583522.1 HAMP domain-containing histidine kinase [Paenibacillus sp. EKM211P]KAF6614930.1 HAMP domain-containing histidine kinase [Paenibacillus sp. EKM101P]KAF6618125.1 HAMP domain-containing histidine kinase [Paenibacillus sp. EKM102P]KAF6626316.1 HAMP domain-containing histidine kinase [Paenibacillus sp. EKM10P]KAF6642773.1 HAMP domain-containing histidine kinase [Paenibacillus sp. EKM11P]
MKLRTKITLLSSILVMTILLFVDVTVHLLFVKIATRNEREVLQNKWTEIIAETGATMILKNAWGSKLKDELSADTILRVFDQQSRLLYEVSRQSRFKLNDIHFNLSQSSQLTDLQDHKILIIHLPVLSPEGSQKGTLEIVEKWDALENNLDILNTILITSTVGAMLLSLVGSTILANAILLPIASSIQTMQEIERSLKFKKIPAGSPNQDELSQMTATFNRMMERLEESFQSQQQFVSDASHELNTTLMIIEGYANMLRRWGTRDEDIRKESIESIYEETQRMRTMTQQLLTLASSQQQDSGPYERVELVGCCQQVVAHLKPVHERQISIFTEEKEIWLDANLAKIKQLLVILLDNALKYSSEEIEIWLSTDEKDVHLRVKDYGIGIPESEIKRVFERFYRVDSSRHRKTGGTGLGLPIAKAITDAHQGTIRMESAEGEGTDVIVTLPQKQQERLSLQ